jgi:hypothetical protein
MPIEQELLQADPETVGSVEESPDVVSKQGPTLTSEMKPRSGLGDDQPRGFTEGDSG